MQRSPYRLVTSGVRELLSIANRLGEKVKDKYIWTHEEIEQAIGYLIYFRDSLKKQKEKKEVYDQIFGESGEFFEIRHFKKGFNTKSITFKTIVNQEVKKWVLKVGHRISIVVDFGDPSSEGYYKQHIKHLAMLRKKIIQQKELRYLLPEPQEVMWAILTEEGIQSATTLILQPFVNVVKPRKIKKRMTDDQRDQLLKEFMAFRKLCKELLEDEKLQPDLLGEGNLEIVEINGEYHLILLDTGLVNTEVPLPFTQTVMHFATVQTLANVENLIKKIL